MGAGLAHAFGLVGFPPLCAGIETNFWSRSLLCEEPFVKGQSGFRQSDETESCLPFDKKHDSGVVSDVERVSHAPLLRSLVTHIIQS